MHLDCQGQELPVLEQALKIGVLDKVRALHVATHSNIIEARILGLLCHAGWYLVTAHTTLASNLRFRYRSRLFLGGDGFQVWVNPEPAFFTQKLDTMLGAALERSGGRETSILIHPMLLGAIRQRHPC